MNKIKNEMKKARMNKNLNLEQPLRVNEQSIKCVQILFPNLQLKCIAN